MCIAWVLPRCPMGMAGVVLEGLGRRNRARRDDGSGSTRLRVRTYVLSWIASRNIGNKPDEALGQGHFELVAPASGELFGGCSRGGTTVVMFRIAANFKYDVSRGRGRRQTMRVPARWMPSGKRHLREGTCYCPAVLRRSLTGLLPCCLACPHSCPDQCRLAGGTRMRIRTFDLFYDIRADADSVLRRC
jgi:hypothetical protein